VTQEVLVVSQTELLVQDVGGETLVEQVTTQEVVTEAQQGPPGPPGSGISVLGRVADIASLPDDADAGDLYIVTAESDHGFAWSGTEWVNVGAIQGPAGPTGPGISVGSGAPSGSGSDGDLYVDTATWGVYRWVD